MCVYLWLHACGHCPSSACCSNFTFYLASETPTSLLANYGRGLTGLFYQWPSLKEAAEACYSFWWHTSFSSLVPFFQSPSYSTACCATDLHLWHFPFISDGFLLCSEGWSIIWKISGHHPRLFISFSVTDFPFCLGALGFVQDTE